MYNCQEVIKIWEKLASYIQSQYAGSEIHLNVANVLANKIVKSPRAHIGNFLCLVTKQYIYRMKCQNQSLDFEGVKREFYR